MRKIIAIGIMLLVIIMVFAACNANVISQEAGQPAVEDTSLYAGSFNFEITPQFIYDIINSAELLSLGWGEVSFNVEPTEMGYFVDDWDMQSWKEFVPMDGDVEGELIIIDDITRNWSSIIICPDFPYVGITYEGQSKYYKISRDIADIIKRQFYELQGTSIGKIDTPLPVAYAYIANEKTVIMLGIGDYAMGTYALQVYRTDDGGRSWSLQTENEAGFIQVNYAAEYLFLSLDVGFIHNPARGGDYARLLITRDGGKTFYVLSFVDENNISPDNGATSLPKNVVYDYYELPSFENGVLTVIVSQGSDGDFNGGKTVLEYRSADMGATWEFVNEYVRPSVELG